jgi:pilus retraction protein PilT
MSVVVDLVRSLEARQASDLFLTEGKPAAVRVDGSVASLDGDPLVGSVLLDFLATIPRARERFDASGDVDVGCTIEGRRFRVNASRTQGRVTLVIRALPNGALDFASLGLPDAVRALADQPRGLVLVTGATGSGKSTTLAAMVHHVNATRPAHVVTVEDPIEFVHQDLVGRVTQREVGADTASFSTALRQVLRQSPDVILVGELRDAETMQVALSAALTGHLVLASIHTIDTTQTLQRILWYFPEHLRNQAALDLSLALRGIVSQRLLPRADGAGRVLALELLTNTPAAARLLREQRTDDLVDLMRADGSPRMITFDHALLALVRAGTIAYETGLAHATTAEELALWAKGMSSGAESFRTSADASTPTTLDMRALLAHVVAEGASDLHLAVGRPPILRIAGELRPLGTEPLGEADVRMLLHSILSSRQRQTYELEREVDFALQLEDGRRFRVNAYVRTGKLAAALRAIPPHIPDPDVLRIPESVQRMADRPHGLLLVVGPTGSGKSTTLACLVNRINHTRACRILTVEDPIEYVHPSIRATVDQREVGADTRSFAAALKYVLRQEPHVILIGEMRDLETISGALTAAETGHLVLATLHTNDATQAIDRIVDVFPPHQQQQVRTQLAASLLGVVSQRLLPRRDGLGRVAAFEVMPGTTAIRALVRDNKMHQALTLMETGRRDGCVTMDHAVADLLATEVITAEDAARYTRAPRLGSR